jgi:hypothetical protein
MDDELFMADPQPKPEESSVRISAFPYPTIIFYSSNKKCKIIAYHMLKSILKRLYLKLSSNYYRIKLKSFLNWKLFLPDPELFSVSEQKVFTMIANFSNVFSLLLKKSFSKWVYNHRTQNIISKYAYNKLRREEAHSVQITQMNKALTQVLNKETEIEKNIALIASREKVYKETIKELINNPVENQQDIQKHEIFLKELELENQNLRDKLEAVENNVNVFIKEMGEVLENEEDLSVPSDDDGMEKKIQFIRIK